MKFIVQINYYNFEFDSSLDALGFARLAAMKCKDKVDVSILIVKEEGEVDETNE